MAVEPVYPPPPEVAAEPDFPSHVVAAQACAVSPLGYVSCPLGLWSCRPSIGRLTSWPASKPVALRSISMTCYLHPNCSSPAKRRGAVSDDQMLQWLFFGSSAGWGNPGRVPSTRRCTSCYVGDSDGVVYKCQLEQRGGCQWSCKLVFCSRASMSQQKFCEPCSKTNQYICFHHRHFINANH